jgi:RNA polymerase sigma-70 factor (ECF subfamily)
MKRRQANFPTTRWSVVLAAAANAAADAASQKALAELCELYWHPLYVFVRRQGIDADNAQDLTQEFFARLLARNYLARVQPEKGRFRSFLLACRKHFLANEWRRARRFKRGGGQSFVPLEQIEDAESRYTAEPCHSLTPARLFERRWALTLLERTLRRVRAEQEAAGKGA